MRWTKRIRRRNLFEPEALGEVIERAGENRFAPKKLPIPLGQWRQIVGPRIADRTRPIELARQTLVVKVTTSVWANELSMLQDQLIAKLVEHGFDIKALRFRVGPLDVVEGVQERREYRKIPPPAPLTPELAKTLGTVEDEELRAMIERAARGSLAWQQKPVAAANEAPPTSRGPRVAGKESVRPGHNEEGSGAASQRRPAGGSNRPR